MTDRARKSGQIVLVLAFMLLGLLLLALVGVDAFLASHRKNRLQNAGDAAALAAARWQGITLNALGALNLAKIDTLTPCRYKAPTVIVVAFDKNNVFTYPGEKRDSGVEDATIVATHMILSATDEGVDSCWINFFDPDKAAEALGLPENEEVLMLLDLGYAAEGAGPLANHDSRKPLTETVTYL